MFRFPSVICTRCTGIFCLAIIKGPPNDIYFIIEGPCDGYFTEKVSYSPKSFLSHEMIRGCKNTGVKKIRIHDIRHSHASLLINQGCDALMLADRLGHEKVSTTLNTYSHLFPHKQQELVHSLESLQATDLPTPEPPSDNPLLEAAGITCEVSQAQDNGSDVTARPQFEPALVPPNTASRKIIQMPQRKII